MREPRQRELLAFGALGACLLRERGVEAAEVKILSGAHAARLAERHVAGAAALSAGRVAQELRVVPAPALATRATAARAEDAHDAVAEAHTLAGHDALSAALPRRSMASSSKRPSMSSFASAMPASRMQGPHTAAAVEEPSGR